MKIILCFPPLQSVKGLPTLGQNRQFQYFKEPTYIYPVVPASAATLLKHRGYEVIWMDCIAQGISRSQCIEFFRHEAADIIAMETKTPVIKEEWGFIDECKKIHGIKSAFALFGDHVTALPEESFMNSCVDYVLTGGDYDFLLENLASTVSSRSGAEKLEAGIWYRGPSGPMNNGAFRLDHDLDSLPFIDRELTHWRQYAYKNGNFRRTPGTYIMSGRDCWWGKCTFCSWPQLYPKFRCRSVGNVLDEVQQLVDKFKVREIMDDTGTFPAGTWLEEFCTGMIKRGLHKKVVMDCNMRFGALNEAQYRLMKSAGFRFLLFGIESANQATLDRLKKNLKVDTIIDSCRACRKAGLYPHITLMFGYPWETYADARRTMDLGKWLLKKDLAYTMQATIVIPYPRTPLYEECREQGWLETGDWSAYDMKLPVMKLGFPREKIPGLVREIYSVSFSPEFIMRKVAGIRSTDDLAYFARGFAKVMGHIVDFHSGHKRSGECGCTEASRCR